jgi:hypothetical protein
MKRKNERKELNRRHFCCIHNVSNGSVLPRRQ